MQERKTYPGGVAIPEPAKIQSRAIQNDTCLLFMKLSFFVILAVLFSLSPLADAKPHGRRGHSSHHYSPRGYNSHGGHRTHQVYRHRYSGRSNYGHSGRGYSRGHRSHRGIYINLFNLLGR